MSVIMLSAECIILSAIKQIAVMLKIVMMNDIKVIAIML
jgi:hypothetical protein